MGTKLLSKTGPASYYSTSFERGHRCTGVSQRRIHLPYGFKKAEHSQYALIEIPTGHLPRFVMVPEDKGRGRKTIILLDNIIRYCLDELFYGFFEYDQLKGYAMKMTRDAEYDLSHEVEHSLLEQMFEGVSQRLTAMPVRFIYEMGMPQAMLVFLCDKLRISNYDSLIPGGRYHNFKDFIDFPNVAEITSKTARYPHYNVLISTDMPTSLTPSSSGIFCFTTPTIHLNILQNLYARLRLIPKC